jgi:hypothetical protein
MPSSGHPGWRAALLSRYSGTLTATPPLSIRTGNRPPLREAEGEGGMKPARVEYHLNDDKSPLIGLLSCIVCKETMKIEKSTPDAEGRDIIQYRCRQCGRIELVRLFHRTR